MCLRCVSIVMWCGSGETFVLKAVCQIVMPSPSSTFLGAWAEEFLLSAVTVQPCRGRGGPMAGSLTRPISAAEVHDPLLAASESAVSRTNLHRTPPKTVDFCVLSSAQVPVATGLLQEIPSRLTEIEYLPILP